MSLFRKKLFILIILSVIAITVSAQKEKTDAIIVGHVVAEGKHLPFVNVSVKGTTMGTVTDETGHYQLVKLPAGPVTLVVSAVGYKSLEKTIIAEANTTREVNFDLEKDILHLDEVVISADRTGRKRTEAPVMVSTIKPELFSNIQSVTLSEGLNFSPGLRLENNCQNCGFTQVRMNGLEGPYTQILINNRPVFSSLAAVYGLEFIPSSMIERVEVSRGGGSALYGSNAIAGTINIILKEPLRNTYEVGVNNTITGTGFNKPGGSVPDYSAHFNTSLVSDDLKTGMTLYGFSRKRNMFDANDDGFSELSRLKNLSLGTRLFHRFSYRSILSVDFFNIREDRDGGSKPDRPLHERDIAEAVKHNMAVGAITYEQYLREYDLLSVYASGQYLDRDSYYGAHRSLSAYGNSKDKSYNFGAQYKLAFDHTSVVAGIENTGSLLTDKKLGYPDYDNAVIEGDSIISVPHVPCTLIADQHLNTTGFFLHYETKWKRTRIAVGTRMDRYQVKNLAREGQGFNTGNVFSPRLSLMYSITGQLKARTSYSHGYRAPRIFNEDLHIETSGARQVIIANDPDLKQETSRSVKASLDYTGIIGKIYTGLLIEGFYTRLMDPFVSEIGIPDENGRVIYTRENAEDEATVSGVNLELKINYGKTAVFSSGFTFQTSRYEEPQDFNERDFFRSPNQYGFFTFDWKAKKKFGFSATGNYTGTMLMPYFGPETNPETGELRESDPFLDLGLKLKYTMKLNGASMQWYTGIKNIFNAYQSDFDTGIDRDPGYIYGPVNPRSIYLGIKIGNVLD